jgi:1,4-dihydroxy-2-naphthoate octaprenyltransferase
VHFNNDYFDAGHDRPGVSTFISGGSGVLVEHPELKRPAMIVSVVLLIISLLLGILLMRLHSHPWLMMSFVLLGNMAGWAYSAPPVRLSSRGLGEVCYVLTGGFLVPGRGYAVLRGALDTNAASMLFPLLLYALLTMLAVQIPDVEVDLQSDNAT